MKKKMKVFVRPDEVRGVLTDAIDGVKHFGYPTTKAEAKREYDPEEGAKEYEITITIARVHRR